MNRRVLSATALTALVASVALTGCSAVDSSEDCTAPITAGALSNSVRVYGDSAESLRVSFDRNAPVLGTQRSIVSSADEPGKVVREGMIVAANFAYVDGVTGEVLEANPSFGTDTADALFLASDAANSLIAGTFCSSVGDTVATVLSAEESASMGILDGSMIVIAEVLQAYESRATGATQSLPSGFPAVTTDETGRPGLVLPPHSAPEEMRVASRIVGDGAAVTSGDNVIGQVLTVNWNGTLQKNSWTEGPQSFGTEEQIAQTGATFRAALTGLPIGSQVVIIDPNGGQPQVSIVDVLAVA